MTTCPKCGGGCWDNREKIRTGVYKPNSPLFSCKDKTCGWKQWPEKEAGAPAARPTTPGVTGSPWDTARAFYQRAQDEAVKVLGARDVIDNPGNLPVVAASIASLAVHFGAEAPAIPKPKAAPVSVPELGPPDDEMPF